MPRFVPEHGIAGGRLEGGVNRGVAIAAVMGGLVIKVLARMLRC